MDLVPSKTYWFELHWNSCEKLRISYFKIPHVYRMLFDLRTNALGNFPVQRIREELKIAAWLKMSQKSLRLLKLAVGWPRSVVVPSIPAGYSSRSSTVSSNLDENYFSPLATDSDQDSVVSNDTRETYESHEKRPDFPISSQSGSDEDIYDASDNDEESRGNAYVVALGEAGQQSLTNDNGLHVSPSEEQVSNPNPNCSSGRVAQSLENSSFVPDPTAGEYNSSSPQTPPSESLSPTVQQDLFFDDHEVFNQDSEGMATEITSTTSAEIVLPGRDASIHERAAEFIASMTSGTTVEEINHPQLDHSNNGSQQHLEVPERDLNSSDSDSEPESAGQLTPSSSTSESPSSNVANTPVLTSPRDTNTNFGARTRSSRLEVVRPQHLNLAQIGEQSLSPLSKSEL